MSVTNLDGLMVLLLALCGRALDHVDVNDHKLFFEEAEVEIVYNVLHAELIVILWFISVHRVSDL